MRNVECNNIKRLEAWTRATHQRRPQSGAVVGRADGVEPAALSKALVEAWNRVLRSRSTRTSLPRGGAIDACANVTLGGGTLVRLDAEGASRVVEFLARLAALVPPPRYPLVSITACSRLIRSGAAPSCPVHRIQMHEQRAQPVQRGQGARTERPDHGRCAGRGAPTARVRHRAPRGEAAIGRDHHGRKLSTDPAEPGGSAFP
jgi:hypothetical protein